MGGALYACPLTCHTVIRSRVSSVIVLLSANNGGFVHTAVVLEALLLPCS